MDIKVDEMDEKHKQSVERLLRAIKERDDLLDFVKVRPFTPAVRTEKLRLIARLTRQIEKFEQSLAKEYELAQEIARLEEKIEKDYEELEKMADKIEPELLAYLAEHNPEAHDKLAADLKAIKEAEDEED